MSNEIIHVTQKTFQTVEQRMKDAGFSPERVKQETSFALQHINKSPALLKCSIESMQQAVLNISNIGLSLNPAAKEAYLIPRWNNLSKSMECVLEPGYVGLVKLLTDAGSIKSILCQIVYEADTFSIDLASNTNPVSHKPELTKSKRGEVKGCYSLATLFDGTRQVEWMDVEEINSIRDRSETYKAFKEGKIKSCTWVSDYGEMSRKTVIKRIYKYLPRTDRMQKVDEAIKVDNEDYTASESQLQYIESLLHTSTLEPRQIQSIEMEMSIMNQKRAGEVINNLRANQQEDDRVTLKRLQSA